MMKLMSLKQYMKMSKPALIRKITQALRAMPKVKLARLCYNITKSKLPRLRVTKRKALPIKTRFPRNPTEEYASRIWKRQAQARYYKKRKTKRKFSRKQLAAQRLFAKRARAGTLRKRRRR